MKESKKHNSDPKTEKNVNKKVAQEKAANNQVKATAPSEADHEIEDGANGVEYDSPVFDKYGPPFLAKSSSNVTLNERAIAVECATKYKVRYLKPSWAFLKGQLQFLRFP